MFTYSLNSLIVFYEVVKARSFSRAAEVLFMTQPGVSNHVSQLEIQTGTRLLIREKGRFKLTKEGRFVFRHAEKMQAIATELENSIRAMRRDMEHIIKIATTPVYSKIMMPNILDSFQKANPEIMIKLDLGSSNDMLKTVFSMENDVVVAANQKTSKKLYAFPLVKEDLVLITCKNHPLSRKNSASLRDIAEHPLVIREEGSSTKKVVREAFESMNIKPSVLIEVKSTEFIKEWVSQGRGVSVLIRRAVSDDENKHLEVVPLKEPLSLEVSVLFLKSRKHDSSIQKFMEHIKDLQAKSALQ
jgi:DNA-binding transcriptional LysR family regulator